VQRYAFTRRDGRRVNKAVHFFAAIASATTCDEVVFGTREAVTKEVLESKTFDDVVS
jgi:hypothetical protein